VDVHQLHRAAEWFALITFVVIGLSHLLRPREWAETYARLHRLGTAGAFINGAISLVPGAAFVASHWIWTWPAAPLTVLGCALVVKGAVCFLAPVTALRSMAKGASDDGRKFRAAGVVLLTFAGFLGYLLWAH
jgi:uncharacterized protein YjeT (DUF2065 family)